jgi:hypothetical protein
VLVGQTCVVELQGVGCALGDAHNSPETLPPGRARRCTPFFSVEQIAALPSARALRHHPEGRLRVGALISLSPREFYLADHAISKSSR